MDLGCSELLERIQDRYRPVSASEGRLADEGRALQVVREFYRRLTRLLSARQLVKVRACLPVDLDTGLSEEQLLSMLDEAAASHGLYPSD